MKESPTKPQAVWTSFEVILPDENGEKTDRGERPVALALARDGDEIETAIGKMRLLQLLGWPAALKSLDIDRADNGDPKIWILKCKPSCWRMYFCVYAEAEVRRILYLHAKCKKKDRRDEEDSRRARALLNRVAARHCGIILFEFPAE